MGGKYTETVFLPHVEEELLKLFGKKIIVGPAADEGSELAVYAGANEFGVTITPKKKTFLAIPLTREAKGCRPSDFTDIFFLRSKDENRAYLARKKGKSIEKLYVLKKSVVIHERSYLRATFDSQDAINKALNLASAAIARIIGGSGRAEDVLHAIGNSLVSSVKLRIRSSIGPANSPATLLTKKGGTTLVDEGRLMGSIQYEVL